MLILIKQFSKTFHVTLVVVLFIGLLFSTPNVLQSNTAMAGVTPSTPIKHLVVIFQENISFDHYFATYPNASNSNESEPQFIANTNTPSVNGLTASLLTAILTALILFVFHDPMLPHVIMIIRIPDSKKHTMEG